MEEERGEAWHTAARLLRPGELGPREGGEEWAAAAAWAREKKKVGGGFWAFGPISREREEKNKSLFFFIQNLFQI